MKENISWILAIGLMAIGLTWKIIAWFDVISFPFSGWIGWILIGIGGFLGQIMFNKESLKVCLFQLIALVAVADGEMSEKEALMLRDYAKQYDISGKCLKAILKDIFGGKLSLRFLMKWQNERRALEHW